MKDGYKLAYSVSLHRNGKIICRFEVSCKAVSIVGDYYQGIPYQPKENEVKDGLPYKYRKSFDRASKWWQDKYSRDIPLHCNLKDRYGRGMGELFATPMWPAGIPEKDWS